MYLLSYLLLLFFSIINDIFYWSYVQLSEILLSLSIIYNFLYLHKVSNLAEEWAIVTERFVRDVEILF